MKCAYIQPHVDSIPCYLSQALCVGSDIRVTISDEQIGVTNVVGD